MSRRALLLIPAVVLAVAAAGCGGGGGKSAESSSGGKPGEQSEIGDAASAEGAAGGETGDAAESGGAADDPGLAPGDGPVTTEPEITFTGEGGEQFCSQMTEMQASFANSQATEPNYSELADKLTAMTPPPELADDWPDFVDMNRSFANDPSGEELRNASPESMQRFSEISTKVSEYMAQVCGL